jgi:hypothetical protein
MIPPADGPTDAPARRSRSALQRSLLLATVVALLAGCGFPAGSAPPASSAPSTSPPDERIDHPTGPTDVVLRFEEGGGFVPPEFLATEAPIFTLYGDGTVIFRDPFATPPAGPGPGRGIPFRVARLSEEQVQELLRFALVEGGLGIARPRYDNPLVADAPTATFEIHAGGLDKTVSVYALGLEGDDVPDRAARRALARLADRLRGFAQTEPTSEPYVPARYRATLLEHGPGVGGAPMRWPWPDLSPADFRAPADPSAPSLPRRVLSAEEAAALGLEAIEGGVLGVVLEGPDGKLYSLSLRPLLPDEDA